MVHVGRPYIREPQDLPFGIKWGRAWSKMVKKVRFKSPSRHASILAHNFWWNSIVQATTKEGFHEKSVVELLAKGWVIVVDCQVT
jgi:hypothetical protein